MKSQDWDYKLIVGLAASWILKNPKKGHLHNQSTDYSVCHLKQFSHLYGAFSQIA